MLQHRIADWDAAYANAANIVGGQDFAANWQQAAKLFRDELTRQGRAVLGHAYGVQPRQRLDLFRPEAAPGGALSFVMADTGRRSTRPTGRILRAAPSSAAAPWRCRPTGSARK